MTAEKWSPRSTVRVLRCDGVVCAGEVRGDPYEGIAHLRGRARGIGWHCQNSGPGHPARDLCPEHLTSWVFTEADPDDQAALDQAALDRAAADMAVRDDLAREVARTWEGLDEDERYGTDFALAEALDRLGAAYQENR